MSQREARTETLAPTRILGVRSAASENANANPQIFQDSEAVGALVEVLKLAAVVWPSTLEPVRSTLVSAVPSIERCSLLLLCSESRVLHFLFFFCPTVCLLHYGILHALLGIS